MMTGISVSSLKDPALAWSSDSFEATIGSENSFPSLTKTQNVSVSYESSQPEVATIDGSGVITLVAAGSTLIKASSTANETYSASTASYLLTVVSKSGSDAYDGSLSFTSSGDPSSDDDISTSAFKGKITITTLLPATHPSPATAMAMYPWTAIKSL